uniref:Secretory calcium-binding phosphoprotein 5 n=2 Tax=Steinernema glaseri TaxID=37863 RepID=A0A1I7Y1V3_9BILA
MATMLSGVLLLFLGQLVLAQNQPALPSVPGLPSAPSLPQPPAPQLPTPQLQGLQSPQLPQAPQLPQFPQMPQFQLPNSPNLFTPPPQLPMIPQQPVPQAAELPGFREAAANLPPATPSPLHSVFVQNAETFLRMNNVPYVPADGKTNPYNPYLSQYYQNFDRVTPAPLVTHNPLFYNAQRLDFTPQINNNAWRAGSERVMNSPYDKAVETPFGRIWLYCKFNCPRGR